MLEGDVVDGDDDTLTLNGSSTNSGADAPILRITLNKNKLLWESGCGPKVLEIVCVGWIKRCLLSAPFIPLVIRRERDRPHVTVVS